MNCSPPGSSVHGISPGKSTRVGCHAFLQGIFPTQGWNLGLPHCRQILYCLRHPGYCLSNCPWCFQRLVVITMRNTKVMTHHLGLLHLPAWPFSCLFHPRDGQACLIPVKLRQKILQNFLQNFRLSVAEGIGSTAMGGMEVVAGLQGHCEWTPYWWRGKEGWEVPCRGMNSSAGWGWDFTSFLWAWLSCSVRSREE